MNKIKTRFSDMESSGQRTEWICNHGIGHHQGVHGCDGCCSGEPLMSKTTKDFPQETTKECKHKNTGNCLACYNEIIEQKEEWEERFIKEFGMHFEFHEDELQFAIEFIREERQKIKDEICRVLRQIGEIADDDDMEKTINLIKKL